MGIGCFCTTPEHEPTCYRHRPSETDKAELIERLRFMLKIAKITLSGYAETYYSSTTHEDETLRFNARHTLKEIEEWENK